MANLGQLKDLVKQMSRQTDTSLDGLIVNQINLQYGMLCEKRAWRELQVDDASFVTVRPDQRLYPMPYVMSDILTDSLRYDYQANVQQGDIINNATGQSGQFYRTYGTASSPMNWQITGGTGVALYSTGTVSISNRGTAVTGSATTFPPTCAGEYIVFHGSAATAGLVSGVNGYDYGYKIASYSSATSITLAEPYRGPDLAAVRFEIRPANNPQLIFDPSFSDGGGKTVQFAYKRKPRRLYNDEDTPEVDPLSMTVVYQVLSSSSVFHSKESDLSFYETKASRAYSQALQGRLK